MDHGVREKIGVCPLPLSYTNQMENRRTVNIRISAERTKMKERQGTKQEERKMGRGGKKTPCPLPFSGFILFMKLFRCILINIGSAS